MKISKKVEKKADENSQKKKTWKPKEKTVSNEKKLDENILIANAKKYNFLPTDEENQKYSNFADTNRLINQEKMGDDTAKIDTRNSLFDLNDVPGRLGTGDLSVMIGDKLTKEVVGRERSEMESKVRGVIAGSGPLGLGVEAYTTLAECSLAVEHKIMENAREEARKAGKDETGQEQAAIMSSTMLDFEESVRLCQILEEKKRNKNNDK